MNAEMAGRVLGGILLVMAAALIISLGAWGLVVIWHQIGAAR